MGNEAEKDLRNKQSNPAGTVDPSQKNPSHQAEQNPNQQDPSKKNPPAVIPACAIPERNLLGDLIPSHPLSNHC